MAYADNFFLPFNLLAANTFLPPAVLILFLKPCTFDLCLLFGWNVIFILHAPPLSNPYYWKNTITIITKKMRKSRKTFAFYNFFMKFFTAIPVHMFSQESYPHFFYKQKLIHILIHRFFAIFKKIVDFKAFQKLTKLWITSKNCQKRGLFYVNKLLTKICQITLFFYFRHFIHFRVHFFIWRFNC